MKKGNKKSFFGNIKDKISNFYQKKIKKSKLKFNMLETVILMLIVFALGLVVGELLLKKLEI